MAELGNGLINYMGHQWLAIEDDIITIGIIEESLEELDEITKVDMPAENDGVEKDEICGEIETKDGSMNIYAPVEGTVFEVNTAVVGNPDLLREDPYGDGWVIKIQASNVEEVKELTSGSNYDN